MNRKSNQSAPFIDEIRSKQLVQAARQALAFSYSPYSNFAVGAALLTAHGRIYTGCNIENANFTGTICAERTAMVKAISEGHQAFTAVAVACKGDAPAWPCGQCRQFMSEFGLDLVVIVDSPESGLQKSTLRQLLPDVVPSAC